MIYIELVYERIIAVLVRLHTLIWELHALVFRIFLIEWFLAERDCVGLGYRNIFQVFNEDLITREEELVLSDWSAGGHLLVFQQNINSLVTDEIELKCYWQDCSIFDIIWNVNMRTDCRVVWPGTRDFDIHTFNDDFVPKFQGIFVNKNLILVPITNVNFIKQ